MAELWEGLHGRRFVGFRLFLLSNVRGVAWGPHTDAYALIVLQVCLSAMNIRGALKRAVGPSGRVGVSCGGAATSL